MQEKQRQVCDLLEITNRQFNECNALYHAVAQRYGLSDAAFWVLYALRTTHEPQTQNRMAAEWGQPKQTLNSAVAAMVKKGLVELCPGNGAHSGKIVTLTDEGRALAERTVEPVIAAEQQAAIAAAAVGQDTVTVLGCLIHGKNPLLYSYYKSRKTDTQWQRCTKNCVKICRLDINPISDLCQSPNNSCAFLHRFFPAAALQKRTAAFIM